MIVDADSSFFRKACLDLFALLTHSDRDSNFFGNNMHQTNPLAIKHGVDDFCI